MVQVQKNNQPFTISDYIALGGPVTTQLQELNKKKAEQ